VPLFAAQTEGPSFLLKQTYVDNVHGRILSNGGHSFGGRARNGFPDGRDRVPKTPFMRLHVSTETAPLRFKPAKVRRFGAFGRGSETLGIERTAWWARQDSNLQPDRYERSALTIELRALNQRRQPSINARGRCAIGNLAASKGASKPPRLRPFLAGARIG
jgi:hypothetical protein